MVAPRPLTNTRGPSPAQPDAAHCHALLKGESAWEVAWWGCVCVCVCVWRRVVPRAWRQSSSRCQAPQA
jgi:hypothetical protein